MAERLYYDAYNIGDIQFVGFHRVKYVFRAENPIFVVDGENFDENGLATRQLRKKEDFWDKMQLNLSLI